MKETNMEHFRGEIEKTRYSFGKQDEYLLPCNGYDCEFCDFYAGNNMDDSLQGCDARRLRWLMSEYKEEPVLTAREKHFVECINDGFIVRDENPYRLHWFSEKPRKILCGWTADSITQIERIRANAMFDVDMFPFITWEDEEPWSVEELRKLKVQNDDRL